MNDKILKHPCADGLTPDCFRLYPAWARQALAYKMLHLILPKQVSLQLPKGLGLPLGPPTPDAIISPRVLVPPVTTPTPPYTGATPPSYVTPWQPGPITGPALHVEHRPAGSFLYQDGELSLEDFIFGDYAGQVRFARPIQAQLNAKVTGVYVRLAKLGEPDGTVFLELWELTGAGVPDHIITGGTSETRTAQTVPDGDDVPVWEINEILFPFPSAPQLTPDKNYAVVFARTGTYSVFACYDFAVSEDYLYDWYYQDPTEAWVYVAQRQPYLKIYGVPS